MIYTKEYIHKLREDAAKVGLYIDSDKAVIELDKAIRNLIKKQLNSNKDSNFNINQ